MSYQKLRFGLQSEVLTKYIPSGYSVSCGIWVGSWRKEQGRNHYYVLAKHENLVPSLWSCFQKCSCRFLRCGKWLLWSHLWRFLQEQTSNQNLYLFFCYFTVLQLALSSFNVHLKLLKSILSIIGIFTNFDFCFPVQSKHWTKLQQW